MPRRVRRKRRGNRGVTHLSMETLLSLRERGTEPGAAAAREHLNECSQCQAELDRLHQRVARRVQLGRTKACRETPDEVVGALAHDRSAASRLRMRSPVRSRES